MPKNATGAPSTRSTPGAPTVDGAPPTVSDIYPCLFYRDAAAAVAWLEKAFGFVKQMAAPGPDDTIAHSELSLGSSVIMVSTSRPERGWVSPLDLSAVNQVICMYVDDVDSHYERAKAASAEIIGDLRDTDYGSRGYECRDPEGNIWCFGNYRPGEYWEK
jgi:uncharacterized glyoxalase superfamily protein PhnB